MIYTAAPWLTGGEGYPLETLVTEASSETDRRVPGAGHSEELRSVQASIMRRPNVGIRLRLVLSLCLCFCLCGALAVITLGVLRDVRDKVRFLEAVESLSFQVQHARRFEKNFFLYGTNLDEARGCAAAARAVIKGQDPDLSKRSSKDLQDLAGHLDAYETLLAECASLDRTAPGSSERLRGLEETIRHHGTAMTDLTEGLASRERTAVNDLLTRSQRLPLVVLGAILAFLALVGIFFTVALMGPIRRFQAYTRQIAMGNFSLIHPARWYRDEFSDLALAVNQMLAELKAHQERCVRAGKLAAVGTFTSGIAHELSNPLNNVAITAETLMESYKDLSDEEKWKLLQDIYFETERAGDIVKSLLDFTRMEKPDLVPLHLEEVVEATRKLLQNEMNLEDVDFEVRFDRPLPEVRGAFNQLRQVFLNLFLNAIHAMPSGGKITVEGLSGEPDRVCVEVTDTGSGIPADILPHIFDPFFTTKDPGKGTGLGLSVSYSIIQKHGGEMRVSSEPGKGSVFHLCFPAAGTGADLQ
jgi:two-component system NtrC family sensor kinase